MFENFISLYQNGFAKFHSLGNNEICKAVDAYTIGHYEKCLNLTRRLLQKNAAYFPLIDLYAKACIYINENRVIEDKNCLLNDILYKLWQLHSQRDDIQEVQKSLIKLAYTHIDDPWSRELLLITEKYAHNLCSLVVPMSSALYSSISLPSVLFSFDEQYATAYCEGASELFRNCLSVQFALAIRKKDIQAISRLPIDITRKKKYLAIILLKTSPEKSTQIIKELIDYPQCNGVFFELQAILIDSYLKHGDLRQAMDNFVQTYLSNPNFVYFGHIDKIFEMLKSGDVDVKDSILSPISCSIYLKYFANNSNKDDIVLYVCYEEYLETQRVHTPSELLSIIDSDNPAPCDIYFLGQVCVPQVMDRSLAFKTSDDVLKERIIICTHLISLDPSYKQQYTDEIHQLTNTLMVQMRRREVETSKIYMDITGIKKLMATELCEAYERYVTFKNIELRNHIRSILKAVSDSTASLKVVFLDGDTMLESILKQIRDIFVADSKYGLDGYLSVRIRHGTLESQLRSCFERLSLITTKGSDGNYQRNKCWLQNRNIPPEIATAIDQVFSDFSSQIDGIISYIKKDLIQIRTEEKNPQGLFNFTVDKNWVLILDSRIDEDTSFEEFQAQVLNDLLDITEKSLDDIRELLNHDINQRFRSVLDTFQTALNDYGSWLKLRDLRNKIASARTEISKELTTISEWFRLTRPDSFQDYSLSLAVGISCNIMESFSSDIKYEQKLNSEIQLKGATLPSMVDLFNTLLDNVIKHSSGGTPRVAHIVIERTASTIIIQIDNPANMDDPEIDKMNEIISHLSEWEEKGGVNREGGSGLLKVKKILSVDLRCNSKISYSYKNHLFTIRIHAELGSVLL